MFQGGTRFNFGIGVCCDDDDDDDDAFYYSISEHRPQMKRLHPPLSLALCSIWFQV